MSEATDYSDDGVRYDTFRDGPPVCSCGRHADYDGRLCCLCAPAPRDMAPWTHRADCRQARPPHRCTCQRDAEPIAAAAPLAAERCIMCGEPAADDCRAVRPGQREYHDLRLCGHYVTPVRGRIGDVSGAMCADCGHYCDGNVTTSGEEYGS